MPQVLLGAIVKYCFILPTKEASYLLRVLPNLEIIRKKFCIGKDFSSQSSHTKKYHINACSRDTGYVAIICSACWVMQFTRNTYVLENVQRSLSLGHNLVIARFFFPPQCADSVAVFNYANMSRGFGSGQKLCTNMSICKHIHPTISCHSLGLWYFFSPLPHTTLQH